MLALVGLAGFKKRNVADLSGGERQRVALARSLAPQPRLLMLDEPLGALDRSLRQRLLMDLIRILRKVNVTTIFVTHDQAEAFAVADSICVMHGGRIEQTAPPQVLYKRPATVRVANFLGFENLIEGKVTAPGSVETQLGNIALETETLTPGRPVTLLIRPEGALSIGKKTTAKASNFIVQGTVTERIFLGSCYRLRLATEQGLQLSFDLTNSAPPPPPGDFIRLLLNYEACSLI
jgi:ABC-type Fe3+/spermidine/putrescine transport system ATPase subunit